MLRLEDKIFASGRARFRDERPDASEPTAKIFVKIDFNGLDLETLAQLDTGAPYSMLETQIAEALDVLDGEGQPIAIDARQRRFEGRLERVLGCCRDERSAVEESELRQTIPHCSESSQVAADQRKLQLPLLLCRNVCSSCGERGPPAIPTAEKRGRTSVHGLVNGYPASLQHVLAELERIDLLIRARVEQAREAVQEESELRGL
jgi:hypothetical protein